MKQINTSRKILSLLVVASLLASACAFAEERGERGEHRGHSGQRAAPPSAPAPQGGHKGPAGAKDVRYGSPHWNYDVRFHHDRYYPVRGYVVPSLPVGHVEVAYRGGRYWFHGGVWFRPSGPRWVVIAPPFGIVVPVLPFVYTTLWFGGQPYYYANEVYYTRVSTGYQVVEAPPINEVTIQEAPPPAVVVSSIPSPPPAPVVKQAPPTDGLFVYPKNGQTPTQTAFDRIECVKWAIGQTGFDPSQGVNDPNLRASFQRAASACLDARGYSVK